MAAGVVLIGALAFVIGRHDGGSIVTGLRLFLWCWIFGMVGYTLYATGLLEEIEQIEAGGPVLAGILAGLVPLAIYATLGRLYKWGQSRR